jgi:hypothetical protein
LQPPSAGETVDLWQRSESDSVLVSRDWDERRLRRQGSRCRGSSGEVAARTTVARDRGERRWRSDAATPGRGGGMERRW